MQRNKKNLLQSASSINIFLLSLLLLGSSSLLLPIEAMAAKSFSIPPTSDSLTIPIGSQEDATMDNNATAYLATENPNFPDPTDSKWSTKIPVSYTFTSTGPQTLYIWGKDATNNVFTIFTGLTDVTTGNSTNSFSTAPDNTTDTNIATPTIDSSLPANVDPVLPAVTAVEPTVSTLPILTGLFAIGMVNNEQVRVLQQYLSQDPSIYPSQIIDGNYNQTVTEAVAQFQDKHGIPTGDGTRGLAGPTTRAKLNEIYGGQSTGSRENLIAQITQRLAELQAELTQLIAQQAKTY